MVFKEFLLVVALSLTVDAKFSWKNCANDGSPAPVKIKKIVLNPQPLKLSKGQKIRFGGTFQVTGDPGTKYKLNLKIKKKIWFAWAPIPCVSNVGSCTYDLECSTMVDLLEEKQCPLSQKVYEVKTRTEVLPEISVPSFLTDGAYWIRADLRDAASSKRISCVEVSLDISS